MLQKIAREDPVVSLQTDRAHVEGIQVVPTASEHLSSEIINHAESNISYVAATVPVSDLSHFCWEDVSEAERALLKEHCDWAVEMLSSSKTTP